MDCITKKAFYHPFFSLYPPCSLCSLFSIVSSYGRLTVWQLSSLLALFSRRQEPPFAVFFISSFTIKITLFCDQTFLVSFMSFQLQAGWPSPDCQNNNGTPEASAGHRTGQLVVTSPISISISYMSGGVFCDSKSSLLEKNKAVYKALVAPSRPKK